MHRTAREPASLRSQFSEVLLDAQRKVPTVLKTAYKEGTMNSREARRAKALIVAVQSRVCALPLSHVIETMRPLPVEPIAGVPTFVQGVAIIRGIPTPVVDLGAVLGASSEKTQRFVTVRCAEKQVALCVDAVLDVRDLETATIQELPPLLQGASKDIVEMIGILDEQFLTILRAGWQLPDDVWQAMASEEMLA